MGYLTLALGSGSYLVGGSHGQNEVEGDIRMIEAQDYCYNQQEQDQKVLLMDFQEKIDSMVLLKYQEMMYNHVEDFFSINCRFLAVFIQTNDRVIVGCLVVFFRSSSQLKDQHIDFWKTSGYWKDPNSWEKNESLYDEALHLDSPPEVMNH